MPQGLATGALESGLRLLPSLAEAVVRVVPYPFDPVADATGHITHRITIEGGDQPGLIARLADIFAAYGANIVRLDATKLPEAEGGRYVTRFAVWLVPDRTRVCLAAVNNTAGSMGLVSRVEAVAAQGTVADG